MLTWVPVFAKKGTTVHEPEPPQDTRTPRGVKVEITCAWCALTGMVPFFTRFLKSVDELPTLTRLGGGGLGACAECCRWYLFSQTPEPMLALISRRVFGSPFDGQERKARGYGISVDPQRIRRTLSGINVDPHQPKRERATLVLKDNS